MTFVLLRQGVSKFVLGRVPDCYDDDNKNLRILAIILVKPRLSIALQCMLYWESLFKNVVQHVTSRLGNKILNEEKPLS